MRPPAFLRALSRSLLTGLVLLAVFRLVLLLLNTGQWQTATTSDVLRAFFDRGLVFDLYVLSWLLALPALMLGIAYASNSARRWPVAIARWTITVGFLFVLLLGCADIPFYDYLNMRLTRVVLITMATPAQALKELVSTPPYLLALGAFAALAWWFARGIARTWAKVNTTSDDPLWRRLLFVLVPLTALFFGIRGTVDLEEEPLSMKDAYFSETPFLNQLGVNAVFSFANSFAEERIDLIPIDDALAQVRRSLRIPEARYTSPIAREVLFDTAADRRNVVLILVESLSAQRMHRYGHAKDLMPFLERLCDSALVFDRFYSAGTRTCNGIFSSLYGLPAVFEQHPLSHPALSALDFHGLPQVLKEQGYRTAFFYPGDPRFDNMNGFLPHNGFDELIGQDDFPDTTYRNSWGVTDHSLFEMALRYIDDRHHGKGPPFLAVIMTISSHVGYNVPDDIAGFAPRSDQDDEMIYEYADAALQEFFDQARKKPWFANTVFVITGDHGQRFDPVYEVPLSYHHVPCIVYAPDLVAAQPHQGFGLQIDIPETVLGLLRIPHVNNTLGIDLLRSQRSSAYFCSDARIAAINDRFYWIRDGEVEHLYEYGTRSTKDVSAQHALSTDSLRTEAVSMTQTMQWLLENKLVGKPVELSAP